MMTNAWSADHFNEAAVAQSLAASEDCFAPACTHNTFTPSYRPKTFDLVPLPLDPLSAARNNPSDCLATLIDEYIDDKSHDKHLATPDQNILPCYAPIPLHLDDISHNCNSAEFSHYDDDKTVTHCGTHAAFESFVTDDISTPFDPAVPLAPVVRDQSVASLVAPAIVAPTLATSPTKRSRSVKISCRAVRSPIASGHTSSSSSACRAETSTGSVGTADRGCARSDDEPATSLSADRRAQDKANDRRRRNREASSRSYYNRKARIARLEATLISEKLRFDALHAREQMLKDESAALKKTLLLRLRSARALKQ
jgi:hypothetical protein